MVSSLWEIHCPWLSIRLMLNYDLLHVKLWLTVNREKSSRQVAMVAKFMDPNKLWSCKYGRKKLTCMTLLYMIALRNKTVAHTFLPSLDNAERPSLSRRVVEIQKCCRHGNLTSHFSSRLCITLLLNNKIVYSKYFFDRWIAKTKLRERGSALTCTAYSLPSPLAFLHQFLHYYLRGWDWLILIGSNPLAKFFATG